MGRGRAKAKQTKVARDLKYRTIDTDFSSLERELRGDGTPSWGAEQVSDDSDSDDDDYDDPYAYSDDDDDDDDLPSRRYS